MNVRQAVIAALRRDPDLIPKMTKGLRGRVENGESPMSSVVQAATALEPIIANAVKRRPSKLNKLGLKSAHILASLTNEDERSNRRLVTIAAGSTVGIVFVDVEGFTTFTAERGDPAALEFLSHLTKLVERATKAAHGELVKKLGDGFLLAFPSASQAVRGAVSLQESVRRDPTIKKSGLKLRVAVHAGEPYVEEDDLLGHDVNLTARLLDHCKAGTVIVSEAAKELAERRLRKIAFGDRRTVKVRGLAGRVGVYVIDPAKQASAA